MPKRDHNYYVYFMSSRTRVLYCGVTNNLRRRVEQHKAGEGSGFTAQYECFQLVYFERFQYVSNALEREKQIKQWTRAKKLLLINEMNPTWDDLSDAWRK